MTTTITGLRTESRCDPCGIDAAAPRFSWRIGGDGRGLRQRAWRILAASSPELLRPGIADLWDSGVVADGGTLHRPYGGRPLPAGRWVHWSIAADCGAGWTDPVAARFLTGLHDGADWQASWIGDDTAGDGPIPARHLRREVRLRAAPALAVVHWCGLGACELTLNGRRTDDRILAPAVSAYRDRVYYLTRDVTGLLHGGVNCLAALLGNGRFSGARLHAMAAEAEPQRPKLLLRLDVTYPDGGAECLVSDGTWRLCDDGPITANSEYTGEHHDARRELPDWDRPGFDDRAWRQAAIVAAPGRTVLAQPIPGLVAGRAVTPSAVTAGADGAWIVHLPHYVSGKLRLRLRGLAAGARVTVRYGERLDAHGKVSQDSLRSATSTDAYTARGGEDRLWEPRFTLHGFEYVQIDGLPAAPAPADALAIPVHDELDAGGSIATSDPRLDRIVANVGRCLIANYRTMPLDSPARDERQGWLGDRNLLAESEACLFDLETLYRKWLLDIRSTQREDGQVSGVAPAFWPVYMPSATWSGAYIAFTEMHWRLYGDPQVVADHYPHLCRFMAFLERQVVDGVLPVDMLGDWCAPPEVPEAIHTMDPARSTVADVLSTTFAADQARMLAELAAVQGDGPGRQRWLALAGSLRDGLNRHLFDPLHGVYGNGSATANLLPLAFGLVPDQERARVLDHLLDRICTAEGAIIPTGMVGSKVLLRTLSACGRDDIALAIAVSDVYPSWGYMARHGATAVWELLNGHCGDPAMNSTAQPMHAGDLVAWASTCLGGIRPAAPGFTAIELRPRPVAGLQRVAVERHTPVGTVRLAWERHGADLHALVSIPGNATATLHLPVADAASLLEGGHPAADADGVLTVRAEAGGVAVSLGSGVYRFAMPATPEARMPRLPPAEILPGTSEHPWRSRVPVALACADASAELRCTVDGSDPGPDAPLYTGPFFVTRSTCVRARAYRPGWSPGSRSQAQLDLYDPNVQGVHYRYYELPPTQTAHLPDYDALTPNATGRHPGFDVHRIAWQIGRRKEFFGASFTGTLLVPADGTWTFFLRSHNSSRLWIDGVQLIDNDDLTVWTDRSGRVRLAAGQHRLRVDYLQLTNDFGLYVSWMGPGTPFQRIPVGALAF